MREEGNVMRVMTDKGVGFDLGCEEVWRVLDWYWLDFCVWEILGGVL